MFAGWTSTETIKETTKRAIEKIFYFEIYGLQRKSFYGMLWKQWGQYSFLRLDVLFDDMFAPFLAYYYKYFSVQDVTDILHNYPKL